MARDPMLSSVVPWLFEAYAQRGNNSAVWSVIRVHGLMVRVPRQLFSGIIYFGIFSTTSTSLA